MLGITDEVNVCDCCGKPNLKSTVAFETECGDIVYFGSVCATRHTLKAAPVLKAELDTRRKEFERAVMAYVRNSPECKAYNAKIEERSQVRPEIRAGLAAMEYIRKERDAYHAFCAKVAADINAEYVCDTFVKFKATVPSHLPQYITQMQRAA